MVIFRSSSIRRTLTMIIVGVSFTIALVALLVVFLNLITSLKDNLKASTVLNAKLVGQYCVVPLTFDYVQEANDVLNKLSAIPHIVNACVYDENGHAFSA